MVEDLRIGTARPEDAECVSDALGDYDPEVEQEHGSWVVTLRAPLEGSVVTDLLSALKQCLDEHQIAAVKVEIGEQSYVMEGMT